MGRVNMAAARPTKNAEHKDANRTTLINRQTTIKQHTMYGLGRGRQDTYIRRPFVQMQAGVLAQLVFGRDLQAQDGRASNVLLPCVHDDDIDTYIHVGRINMAAARSFKNAEHTDANRTTACPHRARAGMTTIHVTRYPHIRQLHQQQQNAP